MSFKAIAKGTLDFADIEGSNFVEIEGCKVANTFEGLKEADTFFLRV